MSKELIDIGVWLYDNLDEAKQDADIASVDGHNVANRHKSVMYVLVNNKGEYFGPINEHKRQNFIWDRLQVAYTANPE